MPTKEIIVLDLVFFLRKYLKKRYKEIENPKGTLPPTKKQDLKKQVRKGEIGF